MAYIKQTWIDNESPLTAERMNHIEDGISSVEYQVSQIQGGTPKAVTQASEMTDTSLIYLYMGDEEGYESGHFYYFDGAQWQDGGQYGADGGINNNARNLLKYILQKVVYTEAGMDVYINALYDALAESGGGGGTAIYMVMNVLTNVTNSNDATGADEGDSYTATLTADSGYFLETVTVTMGGVDITSTAYANGEITIASVTGDVVITAIAVDHINGDIYNLENRTFTANGDAIQPDLGDFLRSDSSFTVLIDADFAGQSSAWCLFAIWQQLTPNQGMSFEENNATTGKIRLMTTSNTFTLARTLVDNVKIAITHVAESNVIAYQYKIGDSAVVSNAVSETFNPIVGTRNGYVGGSNNRGFNGTINHFGIYSSVLDSNIINTYMEVTE